MPLRKEIWQDLLKWKMRLVFYNIFNLNINSKDVISAVEQIIFPKIVAAEIFSITKFLEYLKCPSTGNGYINPGNT